MAEQNNTSGQTLSQKFKNNWLGIVLAIITTGLGGEILGVWDNLIQREDGYIEKYVNSVVKGNQDLVECKKQIFDLETRLRALEMSQGEIPFPYWVKDEDFNIIHLSKEYQRQVLIPLGIPYDSVINTTGAAFGPVFHMEILKNDQDVKDKHKLGKYPETLPNGMEGTSYKYPIPTPFGREYYGGIWIPKNNI